MKIFHMENGLAEWEVCPKQLTQRPTARHSTRDPNANNGDKTEHRRSRTLSQPIPQQGKHKRQEEREEETLKLGRKNMCCPEVGTKSSSWATGEGRMIYLPSHVLKGQFTMHLFLRSFTKNLHTSIHHKKIHKRDDTELGNSKQR